MLTFLTVPKPFGGHIATIQRNAIRSWTLLRPACEVILFGDEAGVAEAAAELGVRHHREVAKNEYGTPLLNDVFASAGQLASHDILCYINTDIVLFHGFPSAVTSVSSRRHRFLVIGRRTNLKVDEELVGTTGWEAALRDRARALGQLQPPCWIDYHVFPRQLLGEIPPFAIGRTTYDNWLIFRARSRRAVVVDATCDILAVHQNHEYGHVPVTRDPWTSPEAQRNRELAGDPRHVFTMDDATRVLRDGRLRPAASRATLRDRFARQAVLRPQLRWFVRGLLALADHTYYLRSKLGIALHPNWRPRR